MPMPLQICLAGATGWAGSALARAIAATDDLKLVSGVSRSHAGRTLGETLGLPGLEAPLYRSAAEALATPCDVFFDYTHPCVARANVAAALSLNVPAVIGTSGLTDDDLAALDALARDRQVGVLAVGNFSVASLVLQKCAEMAARVLPQFEIIDYASAAKPDAPSGTARELAHRLGRLRAPEVVVPIAQTEGPIESRGATLNGVQVHAVRLPGHVLSVEVLLGVYDEKVSLRYDAGTSAEPYVAGALAAIRKVGGFTGLKWGLDSVLEL
jgi:4-hydroxy-tetrahydrodipicolinate reductase